MTDIGYFHEIVNLVYNSGFRGSIVKKYKVELANAFSNYDFMTVAEQDFQSLFARSPIKNRKKVKGCLNNGSTDHGRVKIAAVINHGVQNATYPIIAATTKDCTVK
jgi:3-methyladenine DNA glycosylase Tag